MVDRLPAVDDTSQFPNEVRQRQALNFKDRATPEGAAIAAAAVTFGATDPSSVVPSGTEIIWFQTDGNGNIIDVKGGVA